MQVKHSNDSNQLQQFNPLVNKLRNTTAALTAQLDKEKGTVCHARVPCGLHSGGHCEATNATAIPVFVWRGVALALALLV